MYREIERTGNRLVGILAAEVAETPVILDSRETNQVILVDSPGQYKQHSSHGIVGIERIISCVPEALRDNTTKQKAKHLVVNVIGFVSTGNA